VEATARPGAGSGRVLPFKRSAVKVSRRRRSPWRALWRPAGKALTLVAVPAAAGAWLLTSPRFTLTEVRLDGAGRVSQDWFAEKLSPFQGRNLLTLPLSRVTRNLAGHPWIEGFALKKELPQRLRVMVREREPVAVVETTGGEYFADRGGFLIAPVAGSPLASGLVRVVRDPAVVDSVPRALLVASELTRSQPDWGAGLVRVAVLSERDFRLESAALPFPLLVEVGSVAAGVRSLEPLLPRLAERFGDLARVDLRFPRRIVVEPVNGAPGGA
jgi:hypothetical protein